MNLRFSTIPQCVKGQAIREEKSRKRIGARMVAGLCGLDKRLKKAKNDPEAMISFYSRNTVLHPVEISANEWQFMDLCWQPQFNEISWHPYLPRVSELD